MATIHVEQCSLKLEDPSDAHNLSDVEQALLRDPDALGLTELRRSEFAGLRLLAAKHGFTLVHPNTDVAILLGRRATFKDRQVSYPVKHRALLTATFEFEGNLVTFHETHWHVPAHVSGEVEAAQTTAIIEAVGSASHGVNISFWAGDTNHDMKHENPLRTEMEKAGLITVQAALNEWEPTHEPHNTVIDVVGSFEADKRVHAESVTVNPAGFSDHRSVSAVYTIDPRKGHRHAGR